MTTDRDSRRHLRILHEGADRNQRQADISAGNGSTETANRCGDLAHSIRWALNELDPPQNVVEAIIRPMSRRLP